MRFSKAFFIALPASLVAIGCARSAKNVSLKFVNPAAGPSGTLAAHHQGITRGETVFVDAKPIQPLALPIYPAGSAKPDANPVTIVVRFVVGADGRVEEIGRSIADFSVPTPFSRACFEAVTDAVARWRFEPALL